VLAAEDSVVLARTRNSIDEGLQEV
jgi:hypothetical protein